MRTLQQNEFLKFMFLSLIFGVLLSIFTYVLVRSDQSIDELADIQDINTQSIKPSFGADSISSILINGNDPTSLSAELNRSSIDVDEPNLSSSLIPIKPYNVSSESFGSSSINTSKFEILRAGTYLIEMDTQISSAHVFKWENGTIFAGNTESTLSSILPTTDEYATDHKYLSELVYGLNNAFLVKVSKPTILMVDSFNSVTINSESLLTTPANIVNQDSGAKYSSLPIISRDTWGASTSSWDPYSHTDIDDPSRFTWDPGYFRVSKIVVHHTASPNTADDPSRAVRDIYLYHAYSRGWGDVGYHYIIDSWGNIYEGKGGGDEVYGYHAYTEANTMGIAISLIGNFENEYPTEAQKDSLAKLMAEKSLFYGFDLIPSNGSESSWTSTLVSVYGHQDTWFWCYSGHPLDYFCPSGDMWAKNATACPGRNLESILGTEIVTRARSYASYRFGNIEQAVSDTNEALKDTSSDLNSFIVTYDLPTNVSKSTIEAKIPSHSGILRYEIYQNRVTIVIGDWNNGVIVPPVGWDGDSSGRFFPPSGGPKDRVETLMKIFMLDPDVKTVGVMNKYTISPIE